MTDPTTQADTGALSRAVEAVIALLDYTTQRDRVLALEVDEDDLLPPRLSLALSSLADAFNAARTTSTPPIAAGADAGLSGEEAFRAYEAAYDGAVLRSRRLGFLDGFAAARSTASPAQVGALREALEPRGCPTPGACSCPAPHSPNARAKIICEFMGWPEDGPAWTSAHKLAASLSALAKPDAGEGS